MSAGLKGSGPAILAAAGGRLDRVILSHAHVDHRGGAKELDAPVYCHPDEVADAEMALESIRQLVSLKASSVWTGHSEPVLGDDVNDQLERAAGSEMSRR